MSTCTDQLSSEAQRNPKKQKSVYSSGHRRILCPPTTGGQIAVGFRRARASGKSTALQNEANRSETAPGAVAKPPKTFPGHEKNRDLAAEAVSSKESPLAWEPRLQAPVLSSGSTA
ncbi:hypothetical protein SKAU_G00298250 [Synaphobranchus kaupii]|uniref:Uncharacterized protein n=1 Tax=Synaphobranchus kaupii TaxID=118154 RepID=A0A9Q1EV92_SYNKA|nr:hypothetical protein SKAU_G00298250 [Synaphobranchus kaupii]